MRVVTAIIAAIGVVQLAGGLALAVFRKMTTGAVVAACGGALVVLAMMLVKLGRRTPQQGPDKPATDRRPAPPAPRIDIPAWSRPVIPRNGGPPHRSATWAMLESMRADAIQAATEAAAEQAARRHGPPPAMKPPE
jgi:hypothetical protein